MVVEQNTKICTKCKILKAFTDFNKQTRSKIGIRGYCRKCQSIDNRIYQAKYATKEALRQSAYRAENPDKIRASGATFRAANREKIRAKSAAYYAANKDKIAAYHTVWRKDNKDKKDKIHATNLLYRSANTESIKARQVAWRLDNPESGRIKAHNRRAKKRENGGKLSQGLSAKLFKLQKGKCACCGLPLGENYHMDHIMPIDLGGANSDCNIQLLRSICNQQKYNKHPIDFMQQRGFLL